MSSTSSSRNRKALAPQRDIGRQRVAELLDAAAAVIEERGVQAATMAEIAERAEAKIGSLYRFFPSKQAVTDALVERYAEILRADHAAMLARAARATPEELADILIETLVKRQPQTRAATALLESRSDWSAVRRRFRAQALADIKAALQACAPRLDGEEAEAIAAVVLNNMKTIVQMLRNEAPTSKGAPDELRLMNRLYLAARLGPARDKRKR